MTDSMTPTRKYKLSEKMYTSGNIYLGDHLTRSWTRDERQATSPVVSEPGNKIPSAAPSVYQIKQPNTHAPTTTRSTRSSVRESRGSRKSWAAKNAMQTVTTEELNSWKQSFDNLLQSPHGSRLFRIFLESEIAEENLLFYEACEELKQMKKEKKMQKLIQSIFDDYISVYSPREVNIDYKMREDIVERLNNSTAPDPEVFKDAQLQIYHLMHRDSYPRFLASAQIMKHFSKDTRSKVEKPRHEEVKSKSGSKSRVFCCYGNDDDVAITNNKLKVEESKDSSPREQKTPKTIEKHCEITPSSDTVASSKNTVLLTETIAPSSDSTETSKTVEASKRESGIEMISCVTQNNNDVTNEMPDITKQ